MKPICLICSLFLLSCNPTDHTTHPSYEALAEFLVREKLYEQYDIQQVTVEPYCCQLLTQA